VADIAEAVRYAADHGAKVINMSLGGNRSSKILAAAVRYAHDKGVVVVCAAGNEGRGKVGYPAAYPGAIAVAATQFDGKTSFYSNWGKAIDLAAPGGNTRLDQNGDGLPDGVLQNTILPGHPEQNDYLLFMGTSMASPHVAGVAALLIERGVTDANAVERVLKATAHLPEGTRRDDHYGAGIVDADAALRKVTLDWGGIKLALSSLLALLMLGRLKGKGLLGLRPGAGTALGLLLGSAGFFFLPRWGEGWLDTASLTLSQGLPAWGSLMGRAHQGSPIFHSLLLPLGLTLLGYGMARWRGVLFGLSVGIAGHLLFHALIFSSDVTWIPDVLDRTWLAFNGLACLGLAQLIARR
jgi:serine protease